MSKNGNEEWMINFLSADGTIHIGSMGWVGYPNAMPSSDNLWYLSKEDLIGSFRESRGSGGHVPLTAKVEKSVLDKTNKMAEFYCHYRVS
jgi:hypothetical protein